jgi:hypothetical protein
MKLKTLLVAAAAVVLGASLAFAKVPRLLEVPDWLADPARSDLTQERAGLVARITALRERAATYNATLANRDFQQGSPEAAQAASEKSALDQAQDDYARDAAAFNAKVLSSTAIAPITDFAGEFYIVTPDGRKIGSRDAAFASLNLGTLVVTGPDGHVVIGRPDGTRLTLGPNTHFVVDKYVWNPDPTRVELAVRITKGLVRWATELAGPPPPIERHFRLTTPVAIAGVRGTDFEALSDNIGAGYFKLFSGRIDLTDIKTGAVIELHAGQMVEIAPDGTFGQPTPLDAPRPSI